MVVFNFLNFFAIFLEFCLARRERTKWSDNFYFLSFSAFSNLFWLGMKPSWYFSIFWIFLLFFWNFHLPIGKEWNGAIIFIFSLSQPFPTYLGWKWCHNGIFIIFFNFFAILLEFSLTRQIGTERNDNFYFFSFSSFFNLFWLQNKP